MKAPHETVQMHLMEAHKHAGKKNMKKAKQHAFLAIKAMGGAPAAMPGDAPSAPINQPTSGGVY